MIRHGRRSGRSLAWALGCFALLQVGLLLLWECVGPFWRDPTFFLKLSRLQHRLKKSPEHPLSVVMLGSSRTRAGLQGLVADDFLRERVDRPVQLFNFGVSAAGPFNHLLYLRRLQAAQRPDLLLVEVMPPFLDDHGHLHNLQANQLPTAQLTRDELDLV